jgi:flavodoxin/NAD-dependent dihydropyrimidine dehydrogenase PreA subunit
MKVLIICFSQTGNTEKIAASIGQGINQAGNSCDFVDIKKADIARIREYDLVGLGTPTFFYREPINVRSFLQKLGSPTAPHWFLFCTHGSQIGNTFFYMANALSEKGAKVVGTYDCYAASSLQFYPQPMHTHGHPDTIDIEQAVAFGSSIGAISQRIKNGDEKLVPTIERIDHTWWAEQSSVLTPELFRAVSPPLCIDTATCTKCLLCQEECPVDAIDIEAEPPQIQKANCIYCWYCEKRCPVRAIRADWSSFAKNARSNLAKYVEILQKAEAEGKFRPYLDYKKIV